MCYLLHSKRLSTLLVDKFMFTVAVQFVGKFNRFLIGLLTVHVCTFAISTHNWLLSVHVMPERSFYVHGFIEASVIESNSLVAKVSVHSQVQVEGYAKWCASCVSVGNFNLFYNSSYQIYWCYFAC